MGRNRHTGRMGTCNPRRDRHLPRWLSLSLSPSFLLPFSLSPSRFLLRMQIAVAVAAAVASASAHNYRQMLRQLSVSFASTGGGELWRHSICVTFAAATVAAVCCCCCRRLIRKTLWHLKYCGVRGICCCPGVAMGTGSCSKGAEGSGRWEKGGGRVNRRQAASGEFVFA